MKGCGHGVSPNDRSSVWGEGGRGIQIESLLS